MNGIEIRALTPDDVQAYRVLRMRALRDHPEAFSASYEEVSQRTVEQMAGYLGSPPENQIVLGALRDGDLVGMAMLNRYEGLKIRHRAIIGGMYVTPEMRGQKVGRALLEEIIRRARMMPDLEELVLAVTVGNAEARSLYLSVGFTPDRKSVV